VSGPSGSGRTEHSSVAMDQGDVTLIREQHFLDQQGLVNMGQIAGEDGTDTGGKSWPTMRTMPEETVKCSRTGRRCGDDRVNARKVVELNDGTKGEANAERRMIIGSKRLCTLTAEGRKSLDLVTAPATTQPWEAVAS
jgi:hypothetical protein